MVSFMIKKYCIKNEGILSKWFIPIVYFIIKKLIYRE